MVSINSAHTERVFVNGSEFLRVTLGGKEYDLPFKILGGRKVAFLDISGQVALVESAAEDIVDLLNQRGAEFDTILNPVSKSSALAHSIAVRWSKEHTPITYTAVARKNVTDSRITADYISVTNPKVQTLALTDDDADFLNGKRILVVDDVYGGGGTTHALMELAEKAGAKVVAHAVIGVEGGVKLPEGLIYLFTLPLSE